MKFYLMWITTVGEGANGWRYWTGSGWSAFSVQAYEFDDANYAARMIREQDWVGDVVIAVRA